MDAHDRMPAIDALAASGTAPALPVTVWAIGAEPGHAERLVSWAG